MGQSTSVGCSFGTLHLCASEDGGGPAGVVLPSRCSSAGNCNTQGRVTKAYSLDLAGSSWYLGSGSFGTSFRCAHRAKEELRVMRAIPKRFCDREGMLRELEAIRGLDHPNLVRICDVIEDTRFLWLVMEATPGEDILYAVADSGKQLTEWLVAQLVRQLVLGLQHLHAAGLAHEDVQPRNVLVTDKPMGQELRLKLIDYGLARRYRKSQHVQAAEPLALQFSQCLSPEQVAEASNPRTLLVQPSCDLWASGVITYVLLSGRWPFDAESPSLLHKKIRAGLWAFLPVEAWAVGERAKAFISSLLVVEPDRRSNTGQALEHPFLRLDEVDKSALQPLLHRQEIIRSLRKLSSMQLLRQAVVHSLGTHLQDEQLAELRRHLCSLEPSGKGSLTLSELRHGLVQAGVVLPGRLLPSLQSLGRKENQSRNLKVGDLIEAAAQRRHSLEEVILWSTWIAANPDTSLFLRREEALRVFEQGSSALAAVLGSSAPVCDSLGPSKPEAALPDRVGFDDLLTWVRDAAASQHRSISTLWLRRAGAHASAADLVIRIPRVQGPI